MQQILHSIEVDSMYVHPTDTLLIRPIIMFGLG